MNYHVKSIVFFQMWLFSAPLLPSFVNKLNVKCDNKVMQPDIQRPVVYVGLTMLFNFIFITKIRKSVDMPLVEQNGILQVSGVLILTKYGDTRDS